MKASFLATLLGLITLSAGLGRAQLVQTFEPGEDTSNWNSTWNNGDTVPTFLDTSFGGQNAGGGTSDTQNFYRDFRNNTAGLDVTQPYSISLYTEVISSENTPTTGQFQIIDGSFGSGNAADLQILTNPDGTTFQWQAHDNNTGWQNLNLAFTLGTPYRVILDIDPLNSTYSATVQQVGTGGNVIATSTLTNLAFDPNVINNHQNGSLLFYIQGSAGAIDAGVDNIDIEAGSGPGPTPEPSITALLLLGGAAIALLRFRRCAA